MDVLTFLTKLLEFGAWPAAGLAIILVLRKELQTLLPSIKKFKAGPVEVELERVVKEVEAIKKVAEAAEAKAEVIAAKLDEGDERIQFPRAESTIEASATPLLTEIELKVLRAMIDSRFVTRSVSGVAKESGLSKAMVQATYGSLIAKGLVEQTTNKEGSPRWLVTSSGRIAANEA